MKFKSLKKFLMNIHNKIKLCQYFLMIIQKFILINKVQKSINKKNKIYFKLLIKKNNKIKNYLLRNNNYKNKLLL